MYHFYNKAFVQPRNPSVSILKKVIDNNHNYDNWFSTVYSENLI